MPDPKIVPSRFTARVKNQSWGITAGIGAGVFWGLPFVVPQILSGVPAFEIAFGRFFFFGLMSLPWIHSVIRILRKIPLKKRLELVGLSAIGFWLYTLVLFHGVKTTDGVISSLILGQLPITIPLFSPGRKKAGPLFPLGLGIIFLGLVNLFAFPVFFGTLKLKTPEPSGVLTLFAGLAMWTGYAILNSRFLQKHPEINRKDMASVMGILSLGCMLPLFLIHVDLQAFVHHEQFPIYLLTTAALGIGSSWFANWLWNISSFHCRSEVSGTLLVSETIFGLLYSFMFERRLPHAYEAVSIALFVLGVWLSISALIRAGRTQ